MPERSRTRHGDVNRGGRSVSRHSRHPDAPDPAEPPRRRVPNRSLVPTPVDDGSSSAQNSTRETRSRAPLQQREASPVANASGADTNPITQPAQGESGNSRLPTPLPTTIASNAPSSPPLHSNWAVRGLLYLVVFLHTRYHVTFSACDLILRCLNFVFTALHLVSKVNSMPTTLTTVFAKLGVADQFKVHPVCFQCHKIFEPDSNNPFCDVCDVEIFRPISPDDSDGEPQKREPYMVAPMQCLSDALRQVFKRPGMVAAANSWKAVPAVKGELRGIQDGQVWQTIKGPDGDLFFFGDSAERELRLGVTFSLDWFSRKTSHYGPSHSSGVASFSVQNFSPAIRQVQLGCIFVISDILFSYRADNLILNFMTPGPKEPTSEQLQNYLKKVVDDLLYLYDEGMIIETDECPNGIRVRVALIGIIADHLAMCKLCGFADHGHQVAPCTKCTVTQKDLFTTKSMKNEFPPRDGATHRRLCNAYHALTTIEERDAFFSKHGVRWSEFARLLYFDIVRWTVVDPMHNLLLGVTKTQWYLMWIKTGALRANTAANFRELNVIHEFLETFESPPWAGRLPMRVGEPAGGSLTADEYKIATTGPWAIMIPVVWERFLAEATAEYSKAKSSYEKAQAAYQQKHATATEGEERSAVPKKPTPRMQKGEDLNFLYLCAALKLLVGNSIRTKTLEENAQKWLREYLLGFLKMYGGGNMKPNHHWAVHVPEEVVDFGPVPGFWTFVTERLNKLLKNLNSNNWTGGLLEVSMMREFHRKVLISTVLDNIAAAPRDSDGDPELNFERGLVDLLLRTNDKQTIGTVQDASRHMDESGARVVAGSLVGEAMRLDGPLRADLYRYYNQAGSQRVHWATEPTPNTYPLNAFADIYNFAMLDGRRIIPTSRARRNRADSALIQVRWSGSKEFWVGEIRSIIRHKQIGVQNSHELLAEIEWLQESERTPLDKKKFPWNNFPELGVESWECEYAAQNDPKYPPNIMPLSRVNCQVARGKLIHTSPHLWMTVSLDRYPTSLVEYGFGDLLDE